ncbi:MAG TPA: hypothetical protein VII82_01495 [Polyangiaceae bacterium]|jgi:hypothetical protein
MKITGRLWVTLAGAAVAAAVGLAGCGTTNNIDTGSKTSGLGQSCTRTFDCAAGLVCLENVCFTAAATADGGLADGGEGGVSTGPHLGLLNESCQTSSDCQAPLECIGDSCTVVSYNLTSTGKSCTGECNAAADCCELPVNFSPSLNEWFTFPADGGFETIHPSLFGTNIRCEDLAAYIGDLSACSATTFPSNEEGLAEGCFDYNTYCKCAPNTWACNNNTCSYTAPCTTNSTTVGGCPSETRTNRSLSPTCNISGNATTGSCQAGCATAADCSGTFPLGSGHACSQADAGGADCTCYQSACYFKCSKDIDCASGSTCDVATSLCKQSGCTTSADCVQSTSNPRAQCNASACQIACANDVECISSNGSSGPPGTICAGGFCKAAGCSSDANCSSSAHVFCVTATSTMYTSAVTN